MHCKPRDVCCHLARLLGHRRELHHENVLIASQCLHLLRANALQRPTGGPTAIHQQRRNEEKEKIKLFKSSKGQWKNLKRADARFSIFPLAFELLKSLIF